MDTAKEILSVVIISLLTVNFFIYIGLIFFKEARGILRPIAVIFSLILTLIFIVDNTWWGVDIFGINTLLQIFGCYVDRLEKDYGLKKNVKDNPIVPQVTVVAVKDWSKVPRRKVSCPHCGGPNEVIDPKMTFCAYCGFPLA